MSNFIIYFPIKKASHKQYTQIYEENNNSH